MIHIIISDQYQAPSLFNDETIMVSILDPSNKTFTFRGPRSQHFVARFWDTENPSDTEFMQMKQETRAILAWLKTFKLHEDHDENSDSSQRVIIHCHAGVSRSPAIAWLLRVMLGEDPSEAFQTMFRARPQIWPNTVVCEIGAVYLGLDPSFMKLVNQVNTEIAQKGSEYLGYGG